MGASISLSHNPEDVEQYRRSERDLLERYGLLGKLEETQLQLDSRVDLHGICRTRVWQVGPEEATPVVFVHGGGGTPLDFTPILPYLFQVSSSASSSSSPYRIICIERPGNALSDPFDYSNIELNRLSVAFIVAVLQQLKLEQPVHLVGNSLGGGVCMFYALQHPQQTASLSFLGVPAGFQGMQLPFYHYLLNTFFGRLIFSYVPPLRLVPLFLLWIIFGVPRKCIPREYLEILYRAQAMRNNLLSFYSLLGQLENYASHGGWKLEDLETIHRQKFPVLFIDAPGDPFITKQQRDLLTLYLGEKQHVTLGTGHMPWFADPYGFALALDNFWSTTMRVNSKDGDSARQTAR